MNILKKISTISVAVLAGLSLAACSNNKQQADNDISKSINKPTTVVFWHSMNGVQGKTLTSLTKQFEKQNPKIKIKLENQGSYTDL